MSSPDPENPIVVAAIERALAPYKDILPPDLLEVMREELALTLTEHEVGKGLVKRLQPREAPDYSGEVDDEGKPVVDPAKDPKTKAGGA